MTTFFEMPYGLSGCEPWAAVSLAGMRLGSP